mmetsp:Transcript_35975/g.101304  ORF Transcript_35975/g.101304 Transcript_35975/m.101304 type:complete len:100 (+) Transcript_35975:62-361(+)
MKPRIPRIVQQAMRDAPNCSLGITCTHQKRRAHLSPLRGKAGNQVRAGAYGAEGQDVLAYQHAHPFFFLDEVRVLELTFLPPCGCGAPYHPGGGPDGLP